MKEKIEGKIAVEFISASTGLPLRYKNATEGWLKIKDPCPCCGHKEDLFFHNSTGVFYCHHAGCELNTKPVNAVDFTMKITGYDFKTASKALIDMSGGINHVQKTTANTKVIPDYKLPDKLSAKDRNKSYFLLKTKMNLSEKHKEDLEKRGLTEDEIQILDYKSMWEEKKDEWGNILSSSKNERLAAMRFLQNNGCKVDGLPGALTNSDLQWDFLYGEAYLIWGKDIMGNIFGAQRNNGKKDPKKKYTWLASGSFENGTAQKSRIHYAINRSMDWRTCEATPMIGDTVYLIEGLLKGDICHLKTGHNFLCMAGVTQYSALKREFETLKEYGIKNIVTCWDMDYHTNDGVAKSLSIVTALIREAGFETRQLEWDPAFKGLDDYVVANPNNSIF